MSIKVDWRKPTEADKANKCLSRNRFEKATRDVFWNAEWTNWAIVGKPHILVRVDEIYAAIIDPDGTVEAVQCPDCKGEGQGLVSAHPNDDDSSYQSCQRCSGSGTLTAKDLPPFGYGNPARPPAVMAERLPPVDMILHCPSCGKQHLDAPDARKLPAFGPGMDVEPWTNPPHRSHLCHGCGHIWRPADVPTNGVAAIQTKGKADRPLATGAGSLSPVYSWLDRASQCGNAELYHAARKLMAYYQGADYHDAARPAASGASGHCEAGARCVCGGDLPQIREGCANWTKGGAA